MATLSVPHAPSRLRALGILALHCSLGTLFQTLGMGTSSPDTTNRPCGVMLWYLGYTVWGLGAKFYQMDSFASLDAFNHNLI
jgi:hypothetical protein